MGVIRKITGLLREYGMGVTLNMVIRKLSSNVFIQRKKACKMIKASLNNKEAFQKEQEYQFTNSIKISILTPLYNTDLSMLKSVLDSVMNQTYSNYELCLCDGSDQEHNYVKTTCLDYAKKDSRIKYYQLDENLGISGNTNRCMELAQGDYYALLDHDDWLHPSALFKIALCIQNTGADFIYTDEATFRKTPKQVISTNFKPDYAPDTLRANNYICHMTVFSKLLYEKVGGFRKEYDGSQDHDLILRLTEKANHIEHIPEILYFWRAHEASVVENILAKEYAIQAGQRAVKDHLSKLGYQVRVTSSEVYPTIYKIEYEIQKNPMISIIILNHNHMKDLKTCIDSVFNSTYLNYEIIVVENNSNEQELFTYYKEIERLQNVTVITRNRPFNYSEFNNYGASVAKGEHLIFLNNDTQIIARNWMEEMLMFSQRNDIGAVGARLFFENNTLQHCYVITGIGEDGIAVHAGLGLAKNDYGYLDRIGFHQNVQAVTGACMMIEKIKFIQVKGFDEQLPISYNDVDLCLKLRSNNYLNLYTPFATLYHFESQTRGMDENKNNRNRLKKEAEYMHLKWGEQLNDPYYNPNFSKEKAYLLR